VVWRALALGAVCGVGAIGCEHHGPIPGMPLPERAATPAPGPAVPAPKGPPAPAWWHAEPVREEDGSLSVCASADDAGLLAARRAALAVATARYRAATGAEPEGPRLLADSARLPGGGYRAFVRLTARGVLQPAPAGPAE
jgi:hypothetical protein